MSQNRKVTTISLEWDSAWNKHEPVPSPPVVLKVDGKEVERFWMAEEPFLPSMHEAPVRRVLLRWIKDALASYQLPQEEGERIVVEIQS